MLLRKLKMQNRGNVSLLVLAVLMLFLILFIVVFDLCQIFTAREITKKASDAASLAVAQNLLFFENLNCNEMAEKVAQSNNCTLVECSYNYDEVAVTVEKEVRFVLLDKFIEECGVIRSTSKVKVVYPWDEQFKYCDFYKFSY